MNAEISETMKAERWDLGNYKERWDLGNFKNAEISETIQVTLRSRKLWERCDLGNYKSWAEISETMGATEISETVRARNLGNYKS